MQLNDLSREQQYCIRFVLDWTNRMTEQHGTAVYDEKGNEYNWSTALCRGLYGENWIEHMKENSITMPGEEAVAMAKEWESCRFPEWLYVSSESDEKDKATRVVLEDDIDDALGNLDE